MSAKPAKPPRHGPSGTPPPARAPAAGVIDADAEKTYFRVRAAACAFDTLGAPADPQPCAPADAATTEQGLLSRWLGVAPRPPRAPRRRSPPPPEPAAAPATAADGPGIDAPVIEPDQDAAGPEAVDSYRSASDLTAPDELPQSDVVA